MTAIAIWYEPSDRMVWAVADTRISVRGAQGGVIKTDAASKLLPLRVTCRQMPYMSNLQVDSHYEGTFGFAFADDGVPALMTYATASACLDSLTINGHTDPPQLSLVAGLVCRIGTRFGAEAAESRNQTLVPFEAAVFG